LFCFTFAQNRAYAIDRKVVMMYKAAGYGTLGGALVGTGALIMGLGTTSNIYRGAAIGLYAGIALGAFILVTQKDVYRREARPINPFKPREPIGPDDWQNEEFDEKDFSTDRSSYNTQVVVLQTHFENYGALSLKEEAQKVSFWAPLVSFNF